MKISTDAILLGTLAYAEKPSRILDIGTGTGVIALMLAQRFEEAKITGVELDSEAASQAQENMNQSPFANVPTFGGANDWGVNLVNAPEAWARGYTGQGIVVAVLDTGVDRNHADLAGNIWTNAGEIANDGLDNDGNGYVDDVYGWNFANGNNNTLDVNGHGSHVAGTIAAGNNGFTLGDASFSSSQDKA